MCSQQQLLTLADERINRELGLHIVAAGVHAVDAQTGIILLDLLGLNRGESFDGVEARVLGEGHGDGVESVGEGAHGVLFDAGAL